MRTRLLTLLVCMGGLFLSIADGLPAQAETGEASDFTRFSQCAKSGALCGQCEEAAEHSVTEILADQIGTSKTLESALTLLVSRIEERLGQPFVPILLGQSPSLMSARAKLPKVILKSPESEYLIAFNTDPRSPAYQTIETMRFDGRKGAFRLEQIRRGPKGRIEIETNPVACVRCHGAQPRPLWDTYRAWPGMFAGRDDLIEKDATPTAAYLRLLGSIEAARTSAVGNGTRDRPYLGTPLEQRLRVIRPTASRADLSAALRTHEWARIPHLPNVPALRSRSLRTAEFAGPGHVMFDQLSAAMGCVMKKQIAARLTPHEHRIWRDGLAQWKPGQSLINQPKLERWLAEAEIGDPGFGSRYLVRLRQITQAHREDDRLKIQRQTSWLQSLGATEMQAWAESFSTRTPFVERWFAVPDPGGVRGADESDPEAAAFLDMLLVRHGATLSDASLSVGPVLKRGFRSFSFSDQLIRELR